MNVVFLTMSYVSDISQRGIYTDLMRKFRDEGHGVYIITPHERSKGIPTEYKETDGVHILGVRTLNLQKTSTVEKGIGQLLADFQYSRAINKYLKDVRFDLILYSTPPVTFLKTIRCLQSRNPRAKTYLLLKDIFPQNALDLGMLRRSGIKGLLYKLFRGKEKRLYRLSDNIGCMSPANVRYILKHNPEISADKVEVAPNSIQLVEQQTIDKKAILKKYGLPTDRPLFIYGGNLGKPQGIPFLMDCLKVNAFRNDCHFLIIGNGTEYPKLKQWYANNNPTSITLMDYIPKAEYDQLVAVCDVGLIFLDHRFTIPNYPSRLLSYLENKMPVLCATDPNTDMGLIAQDNGYGFWCESNSVDDFNDILNKMLSADRKEMGDKGYDFLQKNYLVGNTYEAIMRHV